jgi:molybdopterin synthase catalytic subunit
MLNIDMKSVEFKPPISIQSFKELQDRLKDIYDIKLVIYIHYFGRLSTVLKIRTEKLPKKEKSQKK